MTNTLNKYILLEGFVSLVCCHRTDLIPLAGYRGTFWLAIMERNGLSTRMGGGGGYSHFFFMHMLRPSIYPSLPKDIRNFKHTLKLFEILEPPPPQKIPPPILTLKCIEMTPKYSPNWQFCDDPKEYPQNLYTPKNIHFS